MPRKVKKKPTPQQYDEPVSHLLTVGDAREHREWPDYPLIFNLSLDHVPDLIRMVQDEGLHWADSESDEVWAPVHAWRALGQLRAETAVDAILATFYTIDDWDQDWQQSEYPAVLAMIGPAAVPALKTYLARSRHGLWSRVTAANALGKIGQEYPDQRAACITILADQLRHHRQQDPTLNGFLISNLIDLQATEEIDVIEAAFAADNVDLMIQGDWEEVQIALGLLTERQTPIPEHGWIPEAQIPFTKWIRSGGFERLAAAMTEEDSVPPPPQREPDPYQNVGRNEPCPCGSGKKFKKCHGSPAQQRD